MKAVMKTKPGPGLEIVDAPIPEVGPHDVLIKVIKNSICGTDVHIYTWDEWAASRIKPPIIFGHEFVGEVVEVGKEVRSINPGDYVSAETHIFCGHCYLCRTGEAHICSNVKILGVDVNGAFAEYVKVPEQNVWKTDPSIPPEIASLQEPFGNAVYTALVEDITAKTVAIFGGGPIGLMSVGVTKASGADKIFLIEPNPFRLSLGEKMGADILINPEKDNPIEVILDETGGLGVDVVLEMSGAEPAIQQMFKVIRNGGRISLLGIPKKKIAVDFSEDIIFKGIRIYGITGRKIYETWYQTTSFLATGKVDLTPIITHQLKIDEIEKGMELLIKKEAAKIVMSF